jgi:hypothetical protein
MKILDTIRANDFRQKDESKGSSFMLTVLARLTL